MPRIVIAAAQEESRAQVSRLLSSSGFPEKREYPAKARAAARRMIRMHFIFLISFKFNNNIPVLIENLSFSSSL